MKTTAATLARARKMIAHLDFDQVMEFNEEAGRLFKSGKISEREAQKRVLAVLSRLMVELRKVQKEYGKHRASE